MTTVHLLCAGAAQGLVRALEDRLPAELGITLAPSFGAVGAMKEKLLAGAACDVMVVTAAMVDTLIAKGRLLAGSSAALGRVRTGVAVRKGDPVPPVDSSEALRETLLAADTIYFPDPQRATAGIHFEKVVRELGIFETVQTRFRTFPSGAIAMRELSASTTPQPIGCTQITEINYTPGLTLAGALPQPFELATVYTAAIGAHAAEPEAAARLVALLCGSASQALRAGGGFEF